MAIHTGMHLALHASLSPDILLVEYCFPDLSKLASVIIADDNLEVEKIE